MCFRIPIKSFQNKFSSYNKLIFIILFTVLVSVQETSGQLLMHTHGYVAFAPYISGKVKKDGFWPGYRADFLTNVDIFKLGRATMYGTVGNTTLMSINEISGFTLNKLRFNLAANIRYEFENLLIKSTYYRGSIHKISAIEEGTPIWWNSIQVGLGTPGAYYLYLRDEYKMRENTIINSWDAQINIGAFIKPTGTVFSGINHHYRYELFSLVRYHLGVYKKWASFIGMNHNIWILRDSSTEYKISATVNLFRKGAVNFAGLYYTYVFYDSYAPDNEDKMGALGFRIIF